MTASTLLVLLLVLACPLMMMFMMRGGHGHGGGGGGDGREPDPREASTDELRRQRAELDRLIDACEAREHEESDRELTHSGRGGP